MPVRGERNHPMRTSKKRGSMNERMAVVDCREQRCKERLS
jgi:hypothetical protein